jgi:hypothetical protein
VVKAAPRSPLEVVEADLALEFLVVALDAPAQLHESRQLAIRRRRRQVRNVELVLVVARTVLADEPQLFGRRPSLRASLGELDSSECKVTGLVSPFPSTQVYAR